MSIYCEPCRILLPTTKGTSDVVIIGLILTLLFHLLGFALPSLLAAWLLSWLLEFSFSQGLWLSLGVIIVVEYMVQMITDLPGQVEAGFTQRFVATLAAYFFLALSALVAWLLLWLVSVDLSLFEATLLFTISLIAGLFFLFRSGTMGLPRWMTMPDFEFEFDDEEFEDIVITPPKKPSRRRSRGKRPGTN